MSSELKTYSYEGWGMCVHTNEEKKEFIKLIEKVVPRRLWSHLGNKYPSWSGGLFESLIWALNDKSIHLSFDVEQWTATTAVGTLKNIEYTTYVQADTLLLGVLETYRWWKEKAKELGEGDWT